MGKTIVIVSGKGGTGKTTATAALAGCLAALGHKTLCIDADTDLRNLDLCLGLGDSVSRDFNDVLTGVCALGEAVTTHPGTPLLDFLPAPAFHGTGYGVTFDLSPLIKDAGRLYDYCLIDSPAGIGEGFQSASRNADMAVIVATPDFTCYRDAARVNMELAGLGVDDTALIVNRVRPSLLNRMRITIDDAMDFTGTKLLAVIPEDKNVIIALNTGVLLTKQTAKGASAAFMRAARRIVGQNVAIGRIGRFL